jgi:hypothetical protein
MTIFDNGNTRVSLPGQSTGGVPGLGNNCGPNDCDSRGMAVTFSETAMTVSVSPNGVSIDLGNYSPAMGSAQLLANGNYFFENPIVVLSLNDTAGYSLEIGPTPAVPQLGPKCDLELRRPRTLPRLADAELVFSADDIGRSGVLRFAIQGSAWTYTVIRRFAPRARV